MIPWPRLGVTVAFTDSKRFKVSRYQDKLAIEQSVQDGFNLHFKDIAKEDIDKVLNTMCNSFNVCSVLISKSKQDGGGL